MRRDRPLVSEIVAAGDRTLAIANLERTGGTAKSHRPRLLVN
jgi:hypothetical protein